MDSKICALFTLLAIVIYVRAAPRQLFVTSTQTCGKSCAGTLASPYDNIFFALQNVSLSNGTTSIILLGNASSEHYLLRRELNQSNSSSLLYDFTSKVKYTLEDVEIRPLFCDETIVQTNTSLFDKCINRNQSLTLVYKPVDMSLNITKRLSIQNIIFDWTESSQSVNASFTCAQARKRCCNTNEVSGLMDCDTKYYTKQPANINNIYNFIELSASNYTSKQLYFSYLTLRNFRDKTVKSFAQTNGNGSFELVFQNSKVEDVSFGQGLISHVGTGNENYTSTVKFINLNITKYNYWNRDKDTTFNTWKEGYLLYANTNFKGSISVINSSLVDLNAASFYACDYSNLTANFFRNISDSKSDIWARYHSRSYSRESSVIFITRMDGDMTIKGSNFQKIIGLYGAVVHVKDSTNMSSFTFTDTKFDNNFGMQGFANILIVTAPRATTEPARCPVMKVENCEFTNAKGCPGSCGNVGYICYWDTAPSASTGLTSSSSLSLAYQADNATLFTSPKINITNSKFRNNLIPVSNSLAIIGGYYISLNGNEFENNGGTTAEIILYSLNNSNFLEKKPYQYYKSDNNWQYYYAAAYFGQSSALYLDRLFKLETYRNIFGGNWGPWEGSQVLGAAVTIRSWIPIKAGFLKFKEDVFKDHSGIPPGIAQYLVQYGAALKNNSYLPPLITASFDPKDASKFYEKVNKSYIIFDGVEFRNNTLSFDINQGCQYNSYELERICGVMRNNKRYLTGLVKFLSEAELREEMYVDFIVMRQLDEMSFSMVNSKIINNKLLTEGCLFSTLWAEQYLLDNITIRDNKINPTANYFSESADYSEPLLDAQLKNKDGLFCSFKKETTQGFRQGIFLTATNLNVGNNIGTLFNFYPEESSNFSLYNSIFTNNTDPYGPMMNIFVNSKVISKNNIFIGNNNSLGIFFLTSSNASETSTSNTYLANTGKHAGIGYINDKAQIKEVLAKYYWNTVKPSFFTFRDQITPQGGLYFLETAQISFLLSEFKENNAYAGFVIALKSTVSFDLTNITDHNISGNSVIGNIYSSVLTMRQMKMTNNSVTCFPFGRAPSIIIFEKATFIADKLEISNTLSTNQAAFLLGTDIGGTMTNIKFDNFHSSNGGSLMRLDFSKIVIENLACNDIVSLFKLSATELTLRNTVIQNLILFPSSRSLISMIDSTLDVHQFEYIGGSEAGDYYTLFTGSNNRVKMIEARFLNAVNGVSKIFELINSNFFFVARSSFEYDANDTQTLIFDLTSSDDLVIKECTFILAGQVIQANNIFHTFYFVENTVLTNAHDLNAKIASSNTTYFIGNLFLSQSHDSERLLPDSQIYFLNSYDSTYINDNFFASLYGSKGIIRIQALTQPYNINTSSNIFIDNTGSNGGAFHLDVSLPAALLHQIRTIPTANIEDSIFILNKAINSPELRGKGGAIFQTTPTCFDQSTRIKESIFFNNSAAVIGGALYFDYLPPKFEFGCKFKENYANRPNHIGAYPVKLTYFEQEPQQSQPYVPGLQFQEESSSSSNRNLTKWDNIPSGMFVDRVYILGLVDMFGQIVYDDNTSTLEIYPEGYSKDTRQLFSSVLTVEAKGGLYFLSNFKFSHNIDEYYNITFVSSAIQDQKMIPLDLPLSLTASVKIEIYFRQCGRGEIVLKDGNATVCGECQPGLWQTSTTPNAISCKPCKDTTTICLGGDNVGPKKGYWRLNETSDIILACPRSESCLGNEIKDQRGTLVLDPVGRCEEGYRGNLCSNCVAGWAKTRSGACTSCTTDAWFHIRLAITLILQLCLIIRGFRDTMSLCSEYSENKVVKLNGAILIRILTNYLQLVSLVAGIPISWPSLIASFASVSTEISSINQNVFTIDCIFSSEEVYGIKIIFIKLLLESAGGLLIALMSVLFWIIYFIIRRRPILKNKRFINNVITTVIVICFMMQPSAIKSSFSFFQCTNLYREDYQLRYFAKDYDVVCWEGEHLFWTLVLGLPSLVLWSFVLPFIVFNQIRKNKNRLTSQEISQKYSFLYGGYKQSKYYWEIVIMIRKFVFIGVIISASFYSTDLEIYISIFFIALFYFIQSMCLPFSDPQLNFLEKLSLICAATINFCGLYFQFILSTSPVLDIIIMAIGITVNVIFFVAFAKFYFIIQIKKLEEKIKVHKFTIKLLQKLSCCLRCFNLHNLVPGIQGTNDTKVQDHIEDTDVFSPKPNNSPLKFDSLERVKFISNEGLSPLNSPPHQSMIKNSSFFEENNEKEKKTNEILALTSSALNSTHTNEIKLSPVKSAVYSRFRYQDHVNVASNKSISEMSIPNEGNESFKKSEEESITQERDENHENLPLTSIRHHGNKNEEVQPSPAIVTKNTI